MKLGSVIHNILVHNPAEQVINIRLMVHHQHQSDLPKDRSFTANSGTKAAVLPKGRSSTNSKTKIAVLIGYK